MAKSKKPPVDDPTTLTHRGGWVPPDFSAHRPGCITLQVVEGSGPGHKLTLDNTRRIVVGRGRTADFMIDHPSVSGAHFELRLEANGIELRDLKSTNGTWLGHTRVYHAAVVPGTVITAGECQLSLTALEDIEVPVFADNRLGEMFGQSETMRETFARLVKLAKTPLDVLVTGETGTGKELAARAIHAASDRAKGPWVILDCGTQGRSLIEAVLFGYRRGAFTGAEEDRPGLIEAAHGGTLFIDELGELPLDLQVKLLRALDRREVTRIGETKPRKVDIRVVAATNRDLVRMVADGEFREDLFFRIAKSRVEMPPLRIRKGDALMLAERFLEKVAERRGVELRFSDAARETLGSYRWSGNVRELYNCVEREGFMADRSVVDIHIAPSADTEGGIEYLCALPYQEAHDTLDRAYISKVMKATNGKILPAAELLGIDRGTLRSRLKELGLYSTG